MRQGARGRMLEAVTRDAAALRRAAEERRGVCEAVGRERDEALARGARLEAELAEARLRERRLLNEVGGGASGGEGLAWCNQSPGRCNVEGLQPADDSATAALGVDACRCRGCRGRRMGGADYGQEEGYWWLLCLYSGGATTE